MTNFREDHKIKRILSTHPSGNRQAESTNKTIIQNIKKQLNESKVKQREILPEVLREYRTTSKFSTGTTPFSLVYGAQALIPVEVGEPSFMFWYPMEELYNKAMIMNFEFLDERREASLARMAAQK